jgi:WD40 repeat protein
VRLWDASTAMPLAVLVGHRAPVYVPEFSADGARLLTWSEDGTVRLFEASARDDDHVLAGHRSYVYEARVSPDGTRIATCGWDGAVRLWDRSGREARTIDLGRDRIVNTVAWRPDGARLAISAAGTVRVVDPGTGSVEWEIPRSPDGARGIAYAPRGGLLALALPGEFLLLDAVTYEERGRLPLPDVEAIAFTADGRRIAVSRDKRIEVWDVAGASRLHALDGHAALVRCVAFDPTGRLLASASWDGTVRVWDAATGAARATLRGNGRRAHAVAFLPDGRRMLTGGDDGLVVVWDTARFETLVTLPGHRAYVHGIDVFPDGRTVVSASGDCTGRIWTTTPRGPFLHARAAR